MEKTIRAAGVQAFAGHRLPGPIRRAHGLNLLGRQNRKLHLGVDQGRQGGVVGRCLGQPHARGFAAESLPEIDLPPQHLRAQIVRRKQGRDRVAPHLSHGAARGQSRLLVGVALAHSSHDLVVVAREPARQGGAKVEGHPCVIVDDGRDMLLGTENAGISIGAIAFGMNAGIPVQEWRGRRLAWYLVGPGVFPGRLVEVPVDNQGNGRTFLHREPQMYRARLPFARSQPDITCDHA